LKKKIEVLGKKKRKEELNKKRITSKKKRGREGMRAKPYYHNPGPASRIVEKSVLDHCSHGTLQQKTRKKGRDWGRKGGAKRGGRSQQTNTTTDEE